MQNLSVTSVPYFLQKYEYFFKIAEFVALFGKKSLSEWIFSQSTYVAEVSQYG